MRTSRSIVVLLILCATSAAMAGDGAHGVTFLPGRPLFVPPRANPEEARVGVMREFGSTRMRLDIGSGLELLGYVHEADTSATLRVGAEMFVFALTTSYQGVHLQVDAVDGYFGGHVIYTVRREAATTSLRLRILHLSSHFIDGHFRLENLTWIDGQLPRPYSRDYFELTGAYEPHGVARSLLLYAGFSQSWFCRPAEMLRFNALAGFVARTSGWTGSVFGKPTTLYLADHFLLTGVGIFVGANTVECGIKFGPWDDAGVRLFLSLHTGVEQYHQYFDVQRNAAGIGFTLDLP